jgi:hypothetical protein
VTQFPNSKGSVSLQGQTDLTSLIYRKSRILFGNFAGMRFQREMAGVEEADNPHEDCPA